MARPSSLRPLLLLLLFLVGSSSARRLQARGPPPVHVPLQSAAYAAAAPVMAQCQELYHEQPIDHFAFHRERSLEGRTFQQRYFVCAKDWWAGPEEAGPIFFYCGNEADVTLYLNATGLMWENAQAFGALVVFAEHRYYGKSQPFKHVTGHKMDFLSSEQALADYSELVTALKAQLGAEASPVIAFGGSYGGMLASWWRVAYPHIVAGAIAASAPVLDFEGDTEPAAAESFAQIVTRDASPEGGSSPYCADNVRAAWPVMWDLARTRAGRRGLSRAFRLCEELASEEDVWALAFWIQNAFSYMAMGDYPYPSTYILNGQGTLPAWPMRAACDRLDFPGEQADNATLLAGLREAVGVYYNYSRGVGCYDLFAGVNEESQIVEDHWNYQFCTEMLMPSSSDGVRDMWWPAPWNATEQADQCFQRFGVRPRATWISTYYGGRRAFAAASNIVFSNGLLDPWSGTGVLGDLNERVVALLLKEGAHHLDLMWSTPDDPAEVKAVREAELGFIRQWIQEARAKTAQTQQAAAAAAREA